MDTLTHALIGLGLAGLAQIDPQIAQNPNLQQAVWWASVAGSQAPDLDIVTRLNGQKTYLQQHRGFSHSIPSLISIPFLLTILIIFLIPNDSFSKIFFWAFLAVFVHILMDLLTSYGTEAFSPFIKKKLAWDILMIVDIFIILILTSAIIINQTVIGYSGIIFSYSFLIITLYICLRAYTHHKIKIDLTTSFIANKISIIPSLSPLKWQVVIEQDNKFILGLYVLGHGFKQEHIIENEKHHNLFKYILDEPLAKTFINFTRHLCVKIHKINDGHLVKLVDLRYRFKDVLPFSVEIVLDANNNIVSSKFIRRISTKFKDSIS